MEPGAIYRLPSGRFAMLMAINADACTLGVVDVHRVVLLSGGELALSHAAAARLRVAWHADQWQARRADRLALEQERAHAAAE
ncbi:hypothetical protein AZ34_11950 [Hylemonella gracilis str. Niagara R]|uniref:Uncharacterized protein n=2 Tax=Hylemonella gracilis TaxID=80880 RepID=A0A016XLW1_9BURK|nr:hypothetical protein AZ34_11950 [Hylemonella gracilis str. Niagara R]